VKLRKPKETKSLKAGLEPNQLNESKSLKEEFNKSSKDNVGTKKWSKDTLIETYSNAALLCSVREKFALLIRFREKRDDIEE
jgi:hypothetical protein